MRCYHHVITSKVEYILNEKNVHFFQKFDPMNLDLSKKKKKNPISIKILRI